MPNQFDLPINFPVNGLENIDKANTKLDQLAQNVDKVTSKISSIGPASSAAAAATLQATNQAVRATSAATQQAAQTAANAIQNTVHQAQTAYQQLLATINQANTAMRNTPRGGAGAVGTGGGNPGGGGAAGGAGGGVVSWLSASNPSMFFARLMGISPTQYAIGTMVKELVLAIKNMVEESTRGARELQNLSQEFGITAQSAFQLQTAAKLVGVDLGTMGMAARRLGDALEDPAGAGKATAKALTDLGVSMRQGMGGALEDTLQKLAAIEDPAKRAQAAFELFGRSGAQVAIVAENLKSSEEAMQRWGLSLDNDVQHKLVDANAELEAFNVKLTLLKAKAASGIVLPIVSRVEGGINRFFDGWGHSFDEKDAWDKIRGVIPITRQDLGPNAIRVPGVPAGMGLSFATKDQADAALSLLSNNSKEGIDERLAAAKNSLATAEATLRNDAGVITHGDGFVTSGQLQKDREDVARLREEVEKLAAAKKAANKINMFPEALDRLHDRVEALLDDDKGAVARLEEQRDRGVRQYHLQPFSRNWVDWESQYGLLIDDARRQQTDRDKNKAIVTAQELQRIDGTAQADYYKTLGTQWNNAYRDNDPLSRAIFGGNPFPKQLPPGWSAGELGQFSRILTAGNVRINSTLAGPGEQGVTAAENLNLRYAAIAASEMEAVRQAEQLPKIQDEVAAKEKARFEAAQQGLEATIQYEENLADIRKQQLNETRSFVSGWFNASISHQPSAVSNYFRNFGIKTADTIVGNIGAETIGTLNSRLSLQPDLSRNGILGGPGANGQFQANWLGKILSGTPIGIDPAKGGHVDPLQQATDKNTDTTKENSDVIKSTNAALANLIGVMGKAYGLDVSSLQGMDTAAGTSAVSITKSTTNVSGSSLPPVFDTILRPITSSISTIGRAVQGGGAGNIFSAGLDSFNKIIGGIGGTSGTFGKVNLSGGGISTADINAIAMPGMSPTLGGGSGSSAPVPTLPIAGIPWTIPNIGMPSSDGTRNVGYNPAKNQTAAQDESASGGIAKTIGTLLGGAKYGTNGYGLDAVFGGVGRNADGSWQSLSTGEQVGAGLGMAAQVGGGITAAVQGFGKGGARGDLEGIAGAGMAVAPFTGPAAPFVMAGSELAGLVGSLFPDPRQERIQQEQQTVTGDAFIAPAARDYDFAAGGESGAFSLGTGSTLRAGGSNSNYQVTISALDANSFINWANSNPQAMAQGVLAGIQQGGVSELDAEIAWRSQYGGTIPNNW